MKVPSNVPTCVAIILNWHHCRSNWYVIFAKPHQGEIAHCFLLHCFSVNVDGWLFWFRTVFRVYGGPVVWAFWGEKEKKEIYQIWN